MEKDKGLENFMHNAAWFRKCKGLSKSEMASLLHTSVQCINEIESGIIPKELSIYAISALAEGFKVNSAILLLARLDKET